MNEAERNRRESEEEPVEETPGAEAGDDTEVEEVTAEIVEEPEADQPEVGDPPQDAPELGPEVVEPEAEPIETPQDEMLVLAAELEDVRRERDEYLDSMRRMKAEMENSRRRLERDRARFSQIASEKLVRELLPVLDNLERALEVEGDIREGVKATHGGLLAALGREGLEPVDSDGESFDPSVHEAVMGQPSEDHEEDTVIQTLERGYTLNGKTIRVAKVIVAK